MLDSIVGYHVENHQVHIHYYKPRGDSKEAWDNIDIVGFAGIPMQIKVNFLCQDSALAAPLVIDLVRLLDVAKRCGERGIQRQLSMFFKSPYHAAGRDARARPLQAGEAPARVGARDEHERARNGQRARSPTATARTRPARSTHAECPIDRRRVTELALFGRKPDARPRGAPALAR